jgi:hypothetical protein
MWPIGSCPAHNRGHCRCGQWSVCPGDEVPYRHRRQQMIAAIAYKLGCRVRPNTEISLSWGYGTAELCGPTHNARAFGLVRECAETLLQYVRQFHAVSSHSSECVRSIADRREQLSSRHSHSDKAIVPCAAHLWNQMKQPLAGRIDDQLSPSDVDRLTAYHIHSIGRRNLATTLQH